MTPSEFYDALKRHNWDFGSSVDPETFRKGCDEHSRLFAASRFDNVLYTLFQDFEAHHRDGVTPEPERPQS